MIIPISLQIVTIAVAAIVSQWLAWRLRLPSILFLLGCGFALGMMGLINPQQLFGNTLQPLIAASVAIILFEGSLQLRFNKIHEAALVIGRVIIIGAPLGWLLISLGAHYIAALSWPVAITLGGMLVVTGPTVIIPMLRHARLDARVGAILKWEGIINDSLGVLFAVLAYEFFSAAPAGGHDIGFFLVKGVSIALVAGSGYVLARLITLIFERGAMPEYLKAPFLMTVVVTLFFASNLVIDESGLIAVTVLGLMLTNLHESSIEEIRRFKETITLLLVSGVFLLLTAELDPAILLKLSWRSLAFIAALLLVIRPVTILICTLGRSVSWHERVLISWIAPRGIVCAAMAGVIGPLLTQAGFTDGDKILPIAFTIVVVTVLANSLSIDRLARRLKLNKPEGNGLIIIGAYGWSLQLAEVLQQREIPVMIADRDFTALKPARLANVPVFYGEILSDAAENSVDFHSYSTLLAATDNQAYNALVCDTIGHEFGQENTMRLSNAQDTKSTRTTLARHLGGITWGPQDFTAEKLNALFQEGWRFRMTRFGKQDGSAAPIITDATADYLLLGAAKTAGKLSLFSSDYVSGHAALKEDDVILLFERANALIETANNAENA